MAIPNTKDDVYNNIKFFVFRNWKDEDLGRLREFVDGLFDHEKKAVAPFDELTTSHIRIIYSINNYYQIIQEYKDKGFDIFEDEFDISEASSILFMYVTNREKSENTKTRV